MIFNKTQRKIKKLSKYITTIDEEIQYTRFINREIMLNVITPQTAEQINSLIR